MKEDILALLKEESLSAQEISKKLRLESSKDFKLLIKTLARMEEKGLILLTKKGTFKLKEAPKLLEGTYRANDKGFGFITVEGYEDDFFVGKGQQGTALNGDQVSFIVTKEGDAVTGKRSESRIVDVIERAYSRLVGEFVAYPPQMVVKTGYVGYVLPKDRKISDYTCFITAQGLKPVDGTIVVVDITGYPDLDVSKSLVGLVTQEVGFKDAPGMDILTVLHRYNIPTEFDQETIDQANAIPEELDPDEVAKRLDLRDLPIITIDGADSKDLDDAISLQMLDNGNYELGVHIADVSYYVTEGSALDQTALDRGTSVYLADRVVPMLPQRLSNGICSLHPDVDRFTISCIMEMDADGNLVSYKICPSVIRSKKRMVYDRVNQAIVEQNRNAQEEYKDFLTMLDQLRDLHYALYKKRFKRGSIDFETKESKIIVDEVGHPVDIILRERGLAERMIESFMLAANETVAMDMMDKKYPFVYRVHEAPSEEKMQNFMNFMTNFGVMMKGEASHVTAKQLQKVVSQVEGKSYEPVVSTVLLRSMQQAKYDNVPLGHFGLATEHYTHFTSPIRRYPDLMVHRLIRQYAKAKPAKADRPALEDHLEEVCQQSSVMERRAVDAERDVEAMKKAEFMLDKVGEKYTGIISSVTRFGIFIELDNSVEGLVHVSKMADDHYEFMENQLTLFGSRTGKSYHIGQAVEIVVARADVETREIDFELLDQAKAGKTTSRDSQQGPKKGKKAGKKAKSKKGPHQSSALDQKREFSKKTKALSKSKHTQKRKGGRKAHA